MKKAGIVGICILMVLSFASASHAKKVLFIDSYHEGYAWSDGITNGIKEVIGKKGGIELKVIRMDTKRNKSKEFMEQAVQKAKAAIEEFKPDVVIAADDNASKFLIAPHYKDTDLPFVFCGVNWDASQYGFPAKNVTGMVEVNDVEGLIQQLKKFAKGDRVGFIAGEALTNHKEVDNYKKSFNLDVKAYFAKDFEDWKKGFVEIQKEVDLLIVYNYVAVEGWDKEAAKKFVESNTKVPTGTMQAGPMDYSFIGFLKVPEEQGRWAAEAALKIMDGAAPSSIPIAQNKEGNLMINVRVAKSIGAEVPYELIESADKVIE